MQSQVSASGGKQGGCRVTRVSCPSFRRVPPLSSTVWFSAVTTSTHTLLCEKLFHMHHLISSLSPSQQVLIFWLALSLTGFSETKKTGSSAAS